MREKRIFRSLFGNIDIKKNPTAIPDYLDKHFKEKEKTKKERKMMGTDTNELKEKIAEMQEQASMDAKTVSTIEFKNRKKQLLLNQIAKLFLSATFFILFFSKGESIPQEGMFVFLIPYVLILLANRFIKKDESLVQSADRLR